MSANLPLPALAISDWLQAATKQLQAVNIPSAKLDAEIILAHTLHKGRTYLHAHTSDMIEPRDQEIADARLALRIDRVPIAYIIGHKEFYSRRFIVTTATLIPRPESEAIIELLRDIIPNNQPLLNDMTWRLIDVGTGSGCLGITAKLEFPELEVTLSDISIHALKIAKTNAEKLRADVEIIHSDLLKNYPLNPHIIIANLPYVDSSWERSPETKHEPAAALFAGDGGTALINKLINQAKSSLLPGGYLLLEADPTQHHEIIEYAKKNGLKLHAIKDYIIVLQKIRN